MSETPPGTTAIHVKSPRMLADMIAWTQSDFYPDPKSTPPEGVRTDRPAERPSADTIDTVNFAKLDDENDWTDI